MTPAELAAVQAMVKPLVFDANDRAVTVFGVYRVNRGDGVSWWTLDGISDGMYFRYRSGAMAGAQTDYFARIAACLAQEARAMIPAITGGVAAIAAERHRQITAEGWSAEHDDHHKNGELAGAAAAYAAYRSHVPPEIIMGEAWLDYLWPFHPAWLKPTERRRDLIKAGALIAAEIDRLDRAALAKSNGEA